MLLMAHSTFHIPATGVSWVTDINLKAYVYVTLSSLHPLAESVLLTWHIFIQNYKRVPHSSIFVMLVLLQAEINE